MMVAREAFARQLIKKPDGGGVADFFFLFVKKDVDDNDSKIINVQQDDERKGKNLFKREHITRLPGSHADEKEDEQKQKQDVPAYLKV
jgi:hypothetical protein